MLKAPRIINPTYLLLRHSKLPQQSLSIIQTEPPQISVSTSHSPLGLLLLVRLLRGFVGHAHVGEALAAARGVGRPGQLQQALAAHGLDVGARCVPGSYFYLNRCMNMSEREIDELNGFV